MLLRKKYFLILVWLVTSTISSAQYLSKKEAAEDWNEFKALLEKQSSYFQISNFDFASHFKKIEMAIASKDSIPVHFLAFEFEKMIAETIDRHANVRMKAFDESSYELFKLHFPFAVSSLNENIVALEYGKSKSKYVYYSAKYPFLKRINGMDADAFIDKYAYRRKLSPAQAKLTDGLRDLRDIGELYFKQGESLTEVRLTLTNGKADKEIVLPLSTERKSWIDIGSLRTKETYRNFATDKKFNLSSLDKWLPDSIAYLVMPLMLGYDDNPNLEQYLKTTVEKFRNAKALVVDIRGNGGGERDILYTLSGYFIQPAQSPWVANVAYVRSDQHLDEDIASMKGRYLYNYRSDALSKIDRQAIDKFNEGFKTEYPVDTSKFSKPFYMVLHNNDNPLTCPVYILVNEECFSAASVFTSALKGLPNVKIVGVNTNGSSGRSTNFYLKNSGIRIRLSTMLSFQRNGQTLDGNGTSPDVVIERDEKQVLGERDSQLETLLTLIKTK